MITRYPCFWIIHNLNDGKLLVEEQVQVLRAFGMEVPPIILSIPRLRKFSAFWDVLCRRRRIPHTIDALNCEFFQIEEIKLDVSANYVQNLTYLQKLRNDNTKSHFFLTQLSGGAIFCQRQRLICACIKHCRNVNNTII